MKSSWLIASLMVAACGTPDIEPDELVTETEVKRPVVDDPTETEALPRDSAPVPGTLEHVCAGDEAYYYVWPVEPQDFQAPPAYGVWAMSARYGTQGERRNIWNIPQHQTDGTFTSFCACEEEECYPERFVLVPLAW